MGRTQKVAGGPFPGTRVAVEPLECSINLKSLIKTLAADETGAATVEWVGLTAAIMDLGLAVIASVRTGASDLVTDIQTSPSDGTLGVNQEFIL